MKRIKLQEGKSSERKVIYEGKGVCKVMKGGRLVERLQLEKGDNLLEAFEEYNKDKRGRFVRDNDPLSPGWFTTDYEDVRLMVFRDSGEGGSSLALIDDDDSAIWTLYVRDVKEAMKAGSDLSNIPTKSIWDGKRAGVFGEVYVERK